MTKLTTERLEKFVNDIKTDGMCDITDHQVALALRQLLAYELAAKNPLAWVATDSEGFPEYNSHNEFSADCGAGTPLYAAPVLPKQPIVLYMGRELISKEGLELIRDGVSEATKLEGACMASTILGGNHHAQPVIPEGFTCDNGILTANLGAGDVLISNVNWPDSGHAGLAFTPVPQPKRENLADYTDVVSGKSTQDIGSVFVVKSSSVESLLVLREKVDAAIANFGAQPVSEPYKLKDAVADIRNSGVEIDADKIKAERDTLNSPVIPDGWKLVPEQATIAMLTLLGLTGSFDFMQQKYKNMLAAAPAQESE